MPTAPQWYYKDNLKTLKSHLNHRNLNAKGTRFLLLGRLTLHDLLGVHSGPMERIAAKLWRMKNNELKNELVRIGMKENSSGWKGKKCRKGKKEMMLEILRSEIGVDELAVSLLIVVVYYNVGFGLNVIILIGVLTL